MGCYVQKPADSATKRGLTPSARPQYHFSRRLRDFTAILDRNVYTRITALARDYCPPIPQQADYRWAAAVMAFCQIAKIRFQYGSSLREYASHKGGKEALDDFLQFYRADNCDPNAWVDFAVGRSARLDTSSIKDLEPVKDVPKAELFEDKGTDYLANYILALKIALITKENFDPEVAVISLIKWMETKFRFGSSAFLFANLLFSPSHPGRMLKKRTLQDIRNVAWDFSLIQHWRRCAFKGHKNKTPVLLITRDRVVKYLASRMVGADENELRCHVLSPWGAQELIGKKIFTEYIQAWERIRSRPPRPQIPNIELMRMIEEMEKRYLA